MDFVNEGEFAYHAKLNPAPTMTVCLPHYPYKYENTSLKKIDLYPIFSFLLQTLLPKCIKIMKRKRKSTQDVFRSRVDPGKGNSIIIQVIPN
jgi:hypothetical protein